MDINLLKTFMILANTKSFSKTAELQHVVQSTVTARIQELEKLCGKQLFVRNNHKVEVSKAGMTLLPYAERLVKLYDESRVKLDSMDYYEGRLVLSSVDSIWRYVLKSTLGEFLTMYPNISIRAITGHSADINQSLVDGVVDIGFVYSPPRLQRFEVIKCHEDQFVLVVSPNHELSELANIDVQKLSSLDLLFMNWGGAFSEWATHNLSRNLFRLQMTPVSLLFTYVLSGIGPAIVTRTSAQELIASGKLREISITGDSLPPVLQTYAVVHKNKLSEIPIKNWFSIMGNKGLCI